MHRQGEGRGVCWRRLFLVVALLVSAGSYLQAEVWVTGPSHQVARPEKPPAAAEI